MGRDEPRRTLLTLLPDGPPAGPRAESPALTSSVWLLTEVFLQNDCPALKSFLLRADEEKD